MSAEAGLGGPSLRPDLVLQAPLRPDLQRTGCGSTEHRELGFSCYCFSDFSSLCLQGVLGWDILSRGLLSGCKEIKLFRVFLFPCVGNT